ncbi:MAG: cytochrome c3 family protein [Candidatus Riflebacteria bacterium]|nr:cytochrome c3 family protein [Candidatus Riflebacteria bacterium]
MKTNFSEKDEVPFTHKRHATMYSTDCNTCHQKERCNSCHSKQKLVHPFENLPKEDLHKTCNKCHEKTQCDGCHGRNPKDF